MAVVIIIIVSLSSFSLFHVYYSVFVCFARWLVICRWSFDRFEWATLQRLAESMKNFYVLASNQRLMMTRLIKYADNRRDDDVVYRQYTHDTIFWLFYENFQIKMNTQNKKIKRQYLIIYISKNCLSLSPFSSSPPSSRLGTFRELFPDQ